MSFIGFMLAVMAGFATGWSQRQAGMPRRYRNRFGVWTFRFDPAHFPTITFWRKQGILSVHLHTVPQPPEDLFNVD